MANLTQSTRSGRAPKPSRLLLESQITTHEDPLTPVPAASSTGHKRPRQDEEIDSELTMVDPPPRPAAAASSSMIAPSTRTKPSSKKLKKPAVPSPPSMKITPPISNELLKAFTSGLAAAAAAGNGVPALPSATVENMLAAQLLNYDLFKQQSQDLQIAKAEIEKAREDAKLQAERANWTTQESDLFMEIRFREEYKWTAFAVPPEQAPQQVKDWKEVHKEAVLRGVKKSLEQLKQKIRDEKKKYESIKLQQARSGEGAVSEEEKLRRCPYYSILDTVLGTKKKFQPVDRLVNLGHPNPIPAVVVSDPVVSQVVDDAQASQSHSLDILINRVTEEELEHKYDEPAAAAGFNLMVDENRSLVSSLPSTQHATGRAAAAGAANSSASAAAAAPAAASPSAADSARPASAPPRRYNNARIDRQVARNIAISESDSVGSASGSPNRKRNRQHTNPITMAIREVMEGLRESEERQAKQSAKQHEEFLKTMREVFGSDSRERSRMEDASAAAAAAVPPGLGSATGASQALDEMEIEDSSKV